MRNIWTEAIRLFVYMFLLLYFVVSQILQKQFVATELLLPLYLILFLVFSLHAVYIIFLDELEKNKSSQFIIYIFDTLFITALLYYFYHSQSLLVFLFLLNIILAGLQLGKLYSGMVAVFTSFCFSVLLALSPASDVNQYLSFGFNNIAFFMLAFLSGNLKEQIENLGTQLEEKIQDIKVLKDVNYLILENIHSGFMSLSRDFQILLINASAKKITKPPLEVNDFLKDKLPDLYAILEKNQGESTFEYSWQSRVLWFVVHPIANVKKERLGSIVLFSDITEMRQLERQMQQKEKLAAVGQLAAGIAHEIRNPLASMSGSVQFLKDTLQIKGEEEQKLMNIILRETDRLNALISEFMDFVKVDQEPQTKVDLSQVLKESLDLASMDPKYSKAVSVVFTPLKEAQIYADPNKLKQVFLNLIINAHQAMQNTEVKKLDISLERISKGIRLIIQDTGSGMKADVQSRIFEPFFTTKDKGTGLGLAMVHKIIESHSATIEVESQPGQGTKFTLLFRRLA